MPLNLRSKPIRGYVTDSAGNTLYNADITIREAGPNGSYSVGNVKTDNDGYFETKPLPSGVYDIYESGIIVSKHMHSPNENSIQCFVAGDDNAPVPVPMSQYGKGLLDINKFIFYIQIELESTDVALYGSTYPLYEISPIDGFDPNTMLGSIKNIHSSINGNSRLTTTRFDVEYNIPLSANSDTYRKARWAGLPAIRFNAGGKLVAPLDYYSLLLGISTDVYNTENLAGDSEIIIESANDTLETFEMNVKGSDVQDVDKFNSLIASISKGDVLHLTVRKVGTYGTSIYGIYESFYIKPDSSRKTLTFKILDSSNYITNANLASIAGEKVNNIDRFDGMFGEMLNMESTINEKFTVSENVNSQNTGVDIYNYN